MDPPMKDVTFAESVVSGRESRWPGYLVALLPTYARCPQI